MTSQRTAILVGTAIVFFGFFGITWAITAFVSLEPDPFEWHSFTRFVVAAGSLWAAADFYSKQTKGE